MGCLVAGCDSLVALPEATADGVALFAKNSDRPPRECQRLVALPRRRHPAAATVRCQYLELPQVSETAACIGSQPHWLWGFEHGVNEHGVAIGNHSVFAREPLGETGLLGMDLVRLGLERGRSSGEALEVMVALIEAHGQGGSGHLHLDWPYHNSFLIADPGNAWVLEASGRHWAARRVGVVANLSNRLSLGTDWERGSADLESFALARGWWAPERGRLDFAAAYGDPVAPAELVAGGRMRRAAELLAAGQGALSASGLRGILRDHGGEAAAPSPPPRQEEPGPFTLCMHAGPLQTTTAALVARLPGPGRGPIACWVCPGSPCFGIFLPCYLGVRLPAALARGAAEPSRESLWWRLRHLLDLVEPEFAARAAAVRSVLGPLEAALAAEAEAEEAEAAALERAGKGEEARRRLERLSERAVRRALETIAELEQAMGG